LPQLFIGRFAARVLGEHLLQILRSEQTSNLIDAHQRQMK
jgi:hypothetical protein